MCLSVLSHFEQYQTICPSTLSHLNWLGVVDIGTLPSTAKGLVKHKSATLLKNIIECSTQVMEHQNGWVFKLVVVSTGCAIAVDHTFHFEDEEVNEKENEMQKF